MLVSGNPGTSCCGNVLQVVMHSHGYDHCWRESAPRPSTHRGDPYEDGCSDVSRTVAVRGLGERDGPGTADATTARYAATATGCSAARAEHRAGTHAPTAAADHRTSATERATRSTGTSDPAARAASAALFIGPTKPTPALVSAATAVPISVLAAAVPTAAAVPVIDASDAPGDNRSAPTTVRAAAMGALRIGVR
jgi:hypothetical protein